jgi:hypothetical protein
VAVAALVHGDDAAAVGGQGLGGGEHLLGAAGEAVEEDHRWTGTEVEAGQDYAVTADLHALHVRH